MKSVPRWGGQLNLKGKKYYLLGCGCCVAQNFKDRELKKEHKKEMRRAFQRIEE